MKKSPLFTFISIFGLAVSLAAFIMIFLYIYGELTTDRNHENYDNIYRLEHDTSTAIPYPLKPLVTEMMPGVQEMAVVINYSSDLTYKEEEFFIRGSVYADPEMLDIFTIEMIAGDGEAALSEPYKIALSQSEAERIFGYENPLGKSVVIDDKYDFTVVAIFQDQPANVHFRIPSFASIDNRRIMTEDEDFYENWRQWNYRGYILVQPNVNIADITATFNQKLGAYFADDDEDETEETYYLRHIKDVYFYEELRKNDYCQHGNKQYLNMFIVAAILILSIAIINYINLATARAGIRAKEIGIRKIVGASHQNIAFQFLSESFLITLGATILAITFVALLIHPFNDLVQKELKFEFWKNPILAGLLLLGIALVSFFAGIYPSLFLAGRKTIGIMKKEAVHSRKGLHFRKILISIQLIVTISLILATLIISSQMQFMVKNDMGMNRDHILFFYLNQDMIGHEKALKEELLKSPRIQNVSHCHSMITRVRMEWGRNLADGSHVSFFCIPCDEDYLDLLGLEIIEGKNFDNSLPKEPGSFIVNEEFLRQYEIDDPLSVEFSYGQKIVGVVKNFSFQTLHHTIEPMAFLYPPIWSWIIAVKADGNAIDEVKEYINTTCEKFSEKQIGIRFLDEYVEQQYWREKQFGTLFSIFSIIAIVVSSLGILGMILFESERRTKEIGIRKTLGASTTDILLIFGKQISGLLIISCIVAWFCTSWLMQHWLMDFAFRTKMSWWLFAVSGGITFLIATLTYSIHAIKAARRNPVETLKYE
jgi:putative ABC transport system permease protein